MTYLAGALTARGHRIVVACKHNELMLRELESRGVEGHVLPIRGKANLLAPFVIANFARSIGADIIHTHLSTASLWGTLGARLAGIPCVSHVQSLNHKHWYLFANHWITCSDGVKKHLVDQGLSSERIQVLYNGLDPSLFLWPPDGSGIRSELELSPHQPVIGAVAHLSPHKGQIYLIQAMETLVKQHPDLCCLLIGQGKDEQQLRDTVSRLGLERNVRLLGYRHDGAELMRAMDVVVLPSLREGLGIVLIEAGLAGKPAVGTDIIGIREVVVDGQTGLLVPPADSEALAAAIDGLLSDCDRARQMGLRARSRMEQVFSLDAMATGAEAVYYDLLERYRRPAHSALR
jgi:glycosyltransferase involved in cell wall biosynthesis